MTAPAVNREFRCVHGFTPGLCSYRWCDGASVRPKQLSLPLPERTEAKYVRQCLRLAEVSKLRAWSRAMKFRKIWFE